MNSFRRWHRLVLCAAAASALYFPGLGRPALWEPDEGRYAEIAREMVQSGDYVTPRDDWVRYFEKPPLMYWATAAAIEILGPSEFAVRLPVALFSVAEVVVTTALAETMAGAGVGMLAAMVLLLSPIIFGFARFLTLDPALAFFVTASLGAFYAAAHGRDLGSGASRWWLIVAAATVAMGTLTKGPVALVICGGVAFLYLLVEGRLGELRGVPWFRSVVAYCAIVAPWFVVMARRNPEFLGYFFVHEHVQRYLVSTEHAWGPWFLAAIALGGTWPWAYFAPLGVIGLRRDAAEAGAESRSTLRFLSIWFLFVLIFFSIPRSKLGSYVLPGIPPLAIFAGYGLSRLGGLDSQRIRRLMGAFAIVNAIAAGVSAVLLLIAASRLGHPIVLDGMVVAGCLAVAAVASFALVRRGRDVRAAVAAIAIGVIAAMGAAVKARDDAAPMFSYRGLAQAIKPYVQSGCELASYAHQVQSIPFYTHGREAMVDYLGELGAERNQPDAAKSFMDKAGLSAMWSSPGCVVLIVDRRDLDAMTAMLNPEPAVIACEGKKLAICNRPPHSPPVAFGCRPETPEPTGSKRRGLV
jgi:4-amino-4-deoxy-L-arabinose transferase-like glycosyltransferase